MKIILICASQLSMHLKLNLHLVCEVFNSKLKKKSILSSCY